MQFGAWLLMPLQDAAARCVWPVCALELGCWGRCPMAARVLECGCNCYAADKYLSLSGVYAGGCWGLWFLVCLARGLGLAAYSLSLHFGYLDRIWLE